MFSELDLILRYPFKSKNPVLVDVGAHHGFFSRPFAERRWSIFAFEPEDSNFRAFRENLKEFDNVRVFKEAVSDVGGEKVPFYTSDKYYGIHSLKSFDKTHRYAYDVSTTRLDDKLEGLGISRVDLLKIDIEGADFLALKGFDFNKYAPELVMAEFMDSRSVPYFGYGYKDMIDYMRSRGYKTYVSQWDKIKEYGRKNVASEPHKWLGCVPYLELEREPFWGNLIFVRKEDSRKFDETFRQYLKHLTKPALARALRKYVVFWTKKLLPPQFFKFLKQLFTSK